MAGVDRAALRRWVAFGKQVLVLLDDLEDSEKEAGEWRQSWLDVKADSDREHDRIMAERDTALRERDEARTERTRNGVELTAQRDEAIALLREIIERGCPAKSPFLDGTQWDFPIEVATRARAFLSARENGEPGGPEENLLRATREERGT